MSAKRVKPRVAIQPFAQVKVPEKRSGDDVWLYVGKYDGTGEPPPLNVRDFKRAQEAAR